MSGVTKGLDDEIVITGLSGRFPESDSAQELWDNLMAGVDMIKVDDRRWPVGVYEVDTFGKLKDISRFDDTFFGFTPEQAEQCAPDVRIMLEVAWEAIVDSGYNPRDLQNQPIGVYIGNCIVEAGEALTNNVSATTATGFLNSLHSSLPNKVSEFFRFIGPSETHDTGCSASLYSLDTAVMAMRRGEISGALIGGCNLNLKPQPTTALHRMNMVTKSRGCRVYDQSADGYSRAECISLVFLQWRSNSRRIYGRIVNSVTNNDGFKQEGIIFPDAQSQIRLLHEAFEGTCVDAADVYYVEAHGTGTQAGDTQECLAVDSFFCTKRKKDNPLLVGSIKSNLGHAEPASGVASLCKVLLSFIHGVIPPNIHLNNINPKLEAVVQGRVKIVTQPTPLPGNAIVSLNAFGFGGSNAHVILVANEVDGDGGRAEVFFLNGRTEKAVEGLLDIAASSPTRGVQGLLRGLITIPRELYPVRGFLQVCAAGEVLKRTVGGAQDTPPEVWLLLGGLGSQWVGMARGIETFEPFRATIETCQRTITELGSDLNVMHILCSEESSIVEDVVSMFVGLTAFVMGVSDLLKAAGLKIGGVFGHSLGDTICPYVLGLYTAEETIRSAYVRGILIEARADLRGSMYGVNCSSLDIDIQQGVSVACYNSLSHVTVALSGDEQTQNNMLDKLISDGHKTRKINSGGYAFHSPAFTALQEELESSLGFLPSRERPRGWMSSSYPAEDQPDSVGPALFTSNLHHPVYFQQVVEKVPHGALVVEISGNSSLLGLLGNTYKKVGLVRHKRNPRETLLSGLGELYVEGVLSNPYCLIPEPRYPVPRSTPSLSSPVAAGWKHHHKWWVPKLEDFLISTNDAKMSKFVSDYTIDLVGDGPLDIFMRGYSVAGRRVVPLSLGVHLVWFSFARVNDVPADNLSIQLTDVIIHKQLDTTHCVSKLLVSVGIMPKTGHFHVSVDKEVFLSGHVTTYDPLPECPSPPDSLHEHDPGEILSFYDLKSESNSLLISCDKNDFKSRLDTENLEFSEDSSFMDTLKVLDSHTQLLQLERVSGRCPVEMLTAASSILIDGRNFSEASWLDKPYPGACRSDAVWIEGAEFEPLQCACDEFNPLYLNLVAACFSVSDTSYTIGSLHPALCDSLHVCFASPHLLNSSPASSLLLHSPAQSSLHNNLPICIGIFTTEELLRPELLTLEDHFFPSPRAVPPELVGAAAMALCLRTKVESHKSVLLLGDGDVLYKTVSRVLANDEVDLRVFDTSEGNVTDLLGTSESTECCINLSSEDHLIDILSVTGRSGSAINYSRKPLPTHCGMSNMLKNISVVNVQGGSVKDPGVWEWVKEFLPQYLASLFMGSPEIEIQTPGNTANGRGTFLINL